MGSACFLACLPVRTSGIYYLQAPMGTIKTHSPPDSNTPRYDGLAHLLDLGSAAGVFLVSPEPQRYWKDTQRSRPDVSPKTQNLLTLYYSLKCVGV
ncbi:hypothetical protein MAPG_07430 [Magnaporthiopsis poae ATCC 64411]|uniref:Uncharacterized protein n=1 Tax=Magnaporthiopsis poae (strain ATCC 64411 / 73-15) TaxID=644358 RepID=A0A0C4E4N3_MAGP6|nr:hypothetical protein MAPG_07430 [Magnaporthiopsis poae ATCC 64411]